jgi:hypothetical protein
VERQQKGCASSTARPVATDRRVVQTYQCTVQWLAQGGREVTTDRRVTQLSELKELAPCCAPLVALVLVKTQMDVMSIALPRKPGAAQCCSGHLLGYWRAPGASGHEASFAPAAHSSVAPTHQRQQIAHCAPLLKLRRCRKRLTRRIPHGQSICSTVNTHI